MTLRVWTFHLTQWPEGGLLLLHAALILLGNLAMWLSGRFRGRRMDRLPFIFWSGLGFALLSVTQFAWVWYVPALARGLEWLLPLVDILAFFVFGVVSMALAIARAEDAYAAPGKAWYVAIPLLNFALALTGSHDAPPEVRKRGLAAALVFLFAIAAITRSLNSEVTSAVSRTAGDIATNPVAAASLQDIRLAALGLDKALSALIAAETVPAHLGPTLDLISARQQGHSVFYVFTVDEGDVTSLDDTYRQNALDGFCKTFLPYLNLGASADMRYERKDGFQIETLHLTLTACTA